MQAGEVEVRKDVTSERRTIEVPVRREEVYVERTPGSGRSASDARMGETDVRVPVHEEEVTVEKRPVVTEEVRVGKREVEDTERFTDTVQREEAHVETEGNVDARDERR